MTTPDDVSSRSRFWKKSFSRTLGVLTPGELHVLSNARVAIPGLGGVGGLHLITLTRCGVGRFHIADMDVFEQSNLNRQYGARVDTLGLPKVDVLTSDALAINPHLEITGFRDGVTGDNIAAFLDGVDAVVDSLDAFAWRARKRLHEEARARRIPVVAAGPLHFSQTLHVFTPDGMSFENYYDIHDDTPDLEAWIKFFIGTCPTLPHRRYAPASRLRLDKRSGPSFAPALMLDAGAAATETVRLLLGWPGTRPAPHFLIYDARLRKLSKGFLPWGNRGPLQRLKIAWGLRRARRDAASFREALPPPLWNGEGSLPPPVLEHLAWAGVQAPSAENDQPWRLRLSGQEIQVNVIPPDPPLSIDPGAATSAFVLGGAVENIRIAATGFGLTTDIRRDMEASTGPTAVLSFRPGARLDPLIDDIVNRETHRGDYRSGSLPPGILASLTSSAREIDGAEAFWVTEPDRIAILEKAVRATLRVRFEIERDMAHFLRYFRPSLAEAMRTGDGVTAPNLFLPPGGAWAVPWMKPPWLLRAFNRGGISRAAAWNLARSVRRSSALVFVLMPDVTRGSFFDGGRAFQRLWLQATRWGLALQPLAGVPMFGARVRIDGGNEWFPPRSRRDLSTALSLTRQACPEIDFDGRGLVMMARIGYPLRVVREGTFRKPLPSFFSPPVPGFGAGRETSD